MVTVLFNINSTKTKNTRKTCMCLLGNMYWNSENTK